MNAHKLIFLLLLLICSGCAEPLPADYVLQPVDDALVGNNPMVHQVGRIIVDPAGNPLKLRGVLLEGWLQWNGTLWGTGLNSETHIVNRLEQLVGEEQTQLFRKAVYDNFITERDIEMIAALNLNVVRVPINHHVLEDAAATPTYDAIGWQYLDKLIEWCTRHGVYVVIDLHSAPGGQSIHFVADPEDEKLWQSAEKQARTVTLWRMIAARYQDEPMIAGYDLLNEPGYQKPADLLDLYIQIITAIREVDPYHMVIIEGNAAASDFSIFSQPLSTNQAYSFHTYNFLSNEIDEAQMQQVRALGEMQNVPLWNGEFGAHNKEWIMQTVAQFEEESNHVSGWILWPWKRVPEANPTRWRGLMQIDSTPDWDVVRTAVGSLLEPDGTITPLQLQNGMNAFLAAIKADALVPDPEIVEILSSAAQHK